MKIPYVIDNQTHRLADVLRELLAGHAGKSLDIASAYFTVAAFGMLKDGLAALGNFRLLLGAEPYSGEQIGLRPDARAFAARLRGDLEREPFSEATLRLIEDLTRFLKQERVAVRLYQEGFLHAKCYLFYNDSAAYGWDRFQPVAGIVGSSNFTGPGLTTNKELNLTHKARLAKEEVLDDLEAPPTSMGAPVGRDARFDFEERQRLKSSVGARAIAELDEWFERQWHASRDFKSDLIELLDTSKFGAHEYTPYEVYLKALFEYFKDDLDAEPQPAGRSAVDLAEFQEDAVKKARKILARYDGVMIADSVGLGKTWIGKKLLEDFAYHMRQQALVVCPASLRPMWETELQDATIPAAIVSQEELGQQDFPVDRCGDVDLILIDESHNFRNRGAQRYENLERIISLNGGRGRDGGRKKLVLLTATPINNNLFDLYNQLSLFTRGDRSYFAAAGIGDLYRYFLQARRDAKTGTEIVALFNLLEEVVIRRTRPFIRKAYPEATIRGEKIRFPERQLKTERYDLEATYGGIYEQIVTGIENLRLAPYNLEAYKKKDVPKDEFEAGRQEALVGIFKSRYLKRFESSVDAFRISVRRALQFLKTFESYLLDHKLVRSTDFHRLARYVAREDEEDDATPSSLADELDEVEEAKDLLAALEPVDPTQFDLRKLHDAVQHDIDVLTEIWHRVRDIKPSRDAKLQALKALLEGHLAGQKVLIFTYYKDTARYLYRELGGESGKEFRAAIGNPLIRRMDSGADAKERRSIVECFAPRANKRPEVAGAEKEIAILISTDVLSEGQNLQDCAHLINYDLHWNPTRMVQRAGRIDRIGTDFETLFIHNMFPEEGLERLLRLVESLARKIAAIDRAGFLDASVLGEVVHPRNFNTLRRIREEDGAVIEEEEQFTELASNEFLLQTLRAVLGAEGRERLDGLPDGIHSGLMKPRAKGLFFYFQAPAPAGKGRLHFWKYYDLMERRIIDNRYIIANLISCERDTPRVIGDYAVFDVQEKVIEDILRSHQEQEALEEAPKTIDPLQQTVATTIQGFMNRPEVKRQDALAAIRFLSKPAPSVLVKELRAAYRRFQNDGDVKELVVTVLALSERYGGVELRSQRTKGELQREDLRLICFDHLCS
ncbi:MAG TPA: helicase-related protein [Candidatus Margulisiibacteriota bacterium]|nr:helicase-related protein [Candidatus Margulisiibacteriota bacterium]